MTEPSAAPALPAFWKRITDLYLDAVAHAFIVHGNIRDYTTAAPYLPLGRFLTALMSNKRDIVIHIDPSMGMDIPIPAHRDTLKTLLSLPTAPQLPLVTALRSSLSSGSPMPRNAATQSFREVSALLDWLLTETLMAPEQPQGKKGAEEHRLKVALLIDFGDFLLPDVDITKVDIGILTRLIKWAQSPLIGQHHLMVITAESLSALHGELRRGSARWEAIEIPLPSIEARTAFIDTKWSLYQIKSDMTPTGLAQITGGLSLLQIEDILLRGSGEQPLSPSMVSDRKHALIKSEYGDVIHITDPRWSLNQVGGYEYLKTWLEKTIIRPWSAGTLRVGGLLMSGPPGTGKTQLAEALAGSATVPFIVFRLSRILGQYVGNSEKALERALQAFMSLAPAVVFIDELDQTVRRGEHGESSGVDNRVFARLLEFMEDPARRGKVLIVAATNRPDLLDAALRSRFDRTIPVLPPTPEDRAAIIVSQARSRRMEGLRIDSVAVGDVVTKTDGWTGRNLRDLMEVTAELHFDDHLALDEALQEAISVYSPPLRDLNEQTQLALRDMTDLRLVPPAFRALLHGGQAHTPPVTLDEPVERRGNRTI